MSNKDGGPAFPLGQKEAVDGSLYYDAVHPGMTLRDYFAAQALIGFIAAGLASSALGEVRRREKDLTDRAASIAAMELIADGAYIAADAMLKERAK